MIKKKNDRSNLEKKRFLFFEMGIVITLSLLLLAFEWGANQSNSNIAYTGNLNTETDITELTPITRDIIKVKPPVPPEVIVIIEDEGIDLEDDAYEWEFEIDPDEEYVFPDFTDEEPVDDDFHPYALQLKPTYMGGTELEFQKHLQQLVEYPREAKANNLSGKVFLHFVVDEKGKLTKVSIVKSPHSSLSNAVLEALKKTNVWEPGEQMGRKVRVQYTIPVSFILSYN